MIGIDLNFDLVLVKIEGDDFLIIFVGDFDVLKVGEWVLVVGNLFNFILIVIVGIVSVKVCMFGVYGIGGVELFIQIDVVINQGNSGGVLVNVKGELVGINVVFFLFIGVYVGYGFVILISVMIKVVSDLK